VFANTRKAQSFLAGAKQIASEGFGSFKNRLRACGMDALEELPGIGPVTKKHLAKIIGLADVAKDDRWLCRLVHLFGATDANELVTVVGNQFDDSKALTDLVLWRYCADSAWRIQGADSLHDYVGRLKSHEQ
jgi:hypothetical protein